MLHDLPFTTLLQPDKALTVEQAAAWVRDLIDYYSQSVSALYHDTLPEEALSGYTETLRSLLECAGALEQHLCGMCFFLPDELSRAVVAIIVAVYYQSALLDASIEDPLEVNPCVVVDEETLESMGLYLRRVAAHIDSLYHWLMSERYVMLQGVAKLAVSEMRNRIASTSATGSPGRRYTPSPTSIAPNSRSTSAKSKAAEVPFGRLDVFLRILSPDHFPIGRPSSNISKTVELPIHPLDTVADLAPIAGSSSPTTANPSPFRMSLPGWELDHREVESERRPSLTSSGTTCVDESALGSLFHLESKDRSSPEDIAGPSHFEPSPDAREPTPIRPNLKRRRRTTFTLMPSSADPTSTSNPDPDPESAHPRKRRRKINLRTFGPDSTAEGIKVEAYAHMRAYVGRAVPVRGALTGRAGSPVPLPSRNLSMSPTVSQTSAAMRARSLSPLGSGLGPALEGVLPPSVSAEGMQSVWYSAGEHPAVSGAHTRASMLQEPDWRMDGIEVDVGPEGGEFDGESFTTADNGLYLDVGMENEGARAASGSSPSADLSREAEAGADNDEDKDAGAPGVPPGTSSFSPAPVLSSKAKGRRRCFADFFRPFRDIFSRC